jgi:hypothetical protein
LRAGLLYRVRGFHQLVPGFDRARSGHDDKLLTANFQISDADDRTKRHEFAADDLEGLEDRHDDYDPGNRAQVLKMVFIVSVSYGPDDHPFLAANHMRLVAISPYAFAHFLDLFLGCV